MKPWTRSLRVSEIMDVGDLPRCGVASLSRYMACNLSIWAALEESAQFENKSSLVCLVREPLHLPISPDVPDPMAEPQITGALNVYARQHSSHCLYSQEARDSLIHRTPLFRRFNEESRMSFEQIYR